MKTLSLLLLVSLAPISALAGGFAPFAPWNGFSSQSGATQREAYWHNGRIHYRNVRRHPSSGGDKGRFSSRDAGQRIDQWVSGIDRRAERRIQHQVNRVSNPRFFGIRGSRGGRR